MRAGLGAALISAPQILRERTSDFIELTKPKLTFLILFTTFVGFCAGTSGPIPLRLLLHALLGTALLSGGAGAFNMYTEQGTDALMSRTALRPLAAGRLPSGQALMFAFLISIGGLVYMYIFVNHLTSLLAAIIFACYLFLYTPLKAKTWLCTLVGAVPGALPIVMGWTATRGSLAAGAWVLFAIVFFWQMPHFYAIGWMYRDDYARAGLPVLSVIDLSGQRTGRQAVAFISILILISLLPSMIGLAGPAYPVGAILLGSAFLGYGVHFARLRNRRTARRLFLVSAVYLPALLFLLVFDKLAR
jgi:protoheme IX farnesyltransferase